jgi:indolepyruvate ferredoxin oxidoreductase beta subunit
MEKDPYNVVVTGVGGQGNVVASLLMGAALADQGFRVTIGETYGASQRGGSVMSHVRISSRRQYGPLVPPRNADLVIALEPVEAVRGLAHLGNSSTVSVVNTRPVQPVDVISGDLPYPDLDRLFEKIRVLSSCVHFVPATETAMELGNPILANIVLLGVVAAAGYLPLPLDRIQKAVAEYMSPDKVPLNTKAFVMGMDMFAEKPQ